MTASIRAELGNLGSAAMPDWVVDRLDRAFAQVRLAPLDPTAVLEAADAGIGALVESEYAQPSRAPRSAAG